MPDRLEGSALNPACGCSCSRLALAWGLFVGVRWLAQVLLASGGVVNPLVPAQPVAKRQQLAADKGLLDLIEGAGSVPCVTCRWPPRASVSR